MPHLPITPKLQGTPQDDVQNFLFDVCFGSRIIPIHHNDAKDLTCKNLAMMGKHALRNEVTAIREKGPVIDGAYRWKSELLHNMHSNTLQDS